MSAPTHAARPGDEPATPASRRPRLALLAGGFRPFFLLAGLHAALAVPVWWAVLQGHGWQGAPLGGLAWHAHEMLYGFVMAAVAGFVLTAVPNWTGRAPYAGAPLLALVALWLAGRIAVSVPLGLPGALVGAVDVAFPVALALTIAPALLRAGNRRNLVFIGLLGLLFAGNLHFHLAGAVTVDALHLTVNTMALMIALVGGRVIPAFTAAGLRQRGVEVAMPGPSLLDGAALAAMIVVLVVDVLAPGGWLAGLVAATAALLLALRLARWHGHRTLGEPLLWVLHLGYAWLPVALALKAAWLLGATGAGSAWLHALTAGAFPTMILAVMSRAILGHTGRALVAPRAVSAAYLLLTVAALLRVCVPALHPQLWAQGIAAAAALWSVAFVLFLLACAPMLCRPRVDGRPG